MCIRDRIYPQQGWVEHNPMEIWSTQYGVMNEVVAQSGVDVHDLSLIHIFQPNASKRKRSISRLSGNAAFRQGSLL